MQTEKSLLRKTAHYMIQHLQGPKISKNKQCCLEFSYECDRSLPEKMSCCKLMILCTSVGKEGVGKAHCIGLALRVTLASRCLSFLCFGSRMPMHPLSQRNYSLQPFLFLRKVLVYINDAPNLFISYKMQYTSLL